MADTQLTQMEMIHSIKIQFYQKKILNKKYKKGV